MANRGLLRRQIKAAWVETMRETYLTQTINSERSLQVHLVARLLQAVKDDRVNRRMFIEPKLLVNGGETRLYPDILVCNTRSIIGVIEIKYQPNVRPNFLKDFQTLEILATETDPVEIVNNRYRGPDKGAKTYTLAADALYVWAGVYAAPLRTIPSEAPSEELRQKLLVLHGVTYKDRAPDFYAGSRPIGQ